MEFFTQLFSELSQEDSIAILIFLFVSFILGYLAGWLGGRSGQRRLQQSIAEKDVRISELSTTMAALQEEVEMGKADLQRTTLERDETRDQLDLVERERNALLAEKQSYNEEMQRMRLESTTYQQTVEELEDKIANLQSLPQTTNAKEEHSYSVSSEITDRLRTLEEQLQDMQRESHDHSHITQLTNRVVRLEQDHEEWKHSDTLDANSTLQQLAHRIATLEAIHTQDDAGTHKSAAADNDFFDPDSNKAGTEIRKHRDQKPINPLITTLAKEGRLDDLTRISGINEQLQDQLRKAGVHTFDDIAGWNDDDIEDITYRIQFVPGRIAADDWVGQAKLMCNTRGTDEVFLITEYKDNADLTIIEGIDPAAEDILRKAGIYTWQELADTDAEYLQSLLNKANAPTTSYNPESWPAQARFASDEMWKELEELKRSL